MSRCLVLLFTVLLGAACAGGDIGAPATGAPRRPGSTVLPGGGSSGSADHAPVALADTFFVQRGSTLTITPPGFLVNDTDADGDSLIAFPSGSGATIAYDMTTGHVEYGGDISLWRDSRSTGTAHDWHSSGGFSFDASSDAVPGVEEFLYQAYEDTPAALASAPTKIVIVVQ